MLQVLLDPLQQWPHSNMQGSKHGSGSYTSLAISTPQPATSLEHSGVGRSPPVALIPLALARTVPAAITAWTRLRRLPYSSSGDRPCREEVWPTDLACSSINTVFGNRSRRQRAQFPKFNNAHAYFGLEPARLGSLWTNNLWCGSPA